MEMGSRRVIVVGAGVSGLTTALLLSRSQLERGIGSEKGGKWEVGMGEGEGRGYEITVVAKYMPGDYDVEYCSPWAGADFLPVSEEDSAAADHDRRTWPWFRDLAKNCPEAGVCFQETTIHTRIKDLGTPHEFKFPLYPWWRELFPDYRNLQKSELRPGIARAATFTSVCINTAIYLPWLLGQCLAAGITFKRCVLDHISSSISLHHSGKPPHVVINCTGLSSYSLGGVADTSLYPIRGQVVIVRNSLSRDEAGGGGGNFSVSGTDDAENESCYGMTRAGGGGVVLGGCSIKDSWNGDSNDGLTKRILGRAVKLYPELGGYEHIGEMDGEVESEFVGSCKEGEGKGTMGVDVVRVGVGLRPARVGGVRVEREEIGGTPMVHNYGHAGAGYQSSVGCAEVAVGLVEQCFEDGAGTGIV